MAEKAQREELMARAKEKLKGRLSQKRYEHSLNVAQTAVMLAATYGVDEEKAEFAGLIHDWDKGYDDEGIRKRAKELGVKADQELLESMPHMLHGLTAAAVLKDEFPEADDEVLRAVALHTSGDVDMSDLDMVIYVADVIEPGRPYPSMQALRDMVGKVSLEELFLATYQHVFVHLIEQYSRVHPDTVKVWNRYILRSREERGEKGALWPKN
ncbi:MAG: bis(5'-nucleosyl)-tetraphosphatase (symmetrical) YqeK [Eggerthellaceae bacterium]|nr:bis(5'-nucleosyl)-tetraphosphatase (symmetrical) YqeK [Eggerthellaceae bacterium]